MVQEITHTINGRVTIQTETQNPLLSFSLEHPGFLALPQVYEANLIESSYLIINLF